MRCGIIIVLASSPFRVPLAPFPPLASEIPALMSKKEGQTEKNKKKKEQKKKRKMSVGVSQGEAQSRKRRMVNPKPTKFPGLTLRRQV